MLKFIVDDINTVPEAMRGLYTQRGDGKWVLQVDGAVPQEKLVEFRENNIRLQKELEKFKDVDPVKYGELLKIETDLKSGKVKDGKTVEEIVEERVGAMRKTHETEKTDLTKRLESTTGELARLKISDAAVAKATELGLRAGARDDLVARVTGIFTLKDGKPVALKDGVEIYGKTGEPLRIEDYVNELVEKAPHLFESSNGTGAGGSGGPGKPPVGRLGVNPWKKETWNVTKQGEMFRAHPDAARKMAAEAGHRLP